MSFSYYEKIGDSITDIADEIPFELPNYCVFVRFKDIWELLSGRDLAPCDYNDQCYGVPYITGASNFFNGSVVISRWTDSPQVITKLGDLLITCKGTVGEIAFNTIGDAHIARQIMAIRNIVKEGDPVLRKTSRSVLNFDEKLAQLLDDMKDTMYKAEGVGLPVFADINNTLYLSKITA